MKKAAMMEAWFDTVSTPLGEVHLAVTRRGLAAVGLGGSETAWLRAVEKRLGGRPVRKAAAVRAAAAQVRAYAAGRLRRFTLRVDWTGLPPFTAKVLRAAGRIPYGRVSTYGDLARAVGRPAAARAVGGALGANPYLLVVPCHRVITTNGKPGGYSAPGGIPLKMKLLRMEGRASIR